MQLKINGKGCKIGESLQIHIEEKLPPAVQKYFEKVTDIMVVISKERSFFKVDINVHLWRGMMLQAHGESSDVYAAFEEALNHISTRLRRNKRRLRNHHGKEEQELPALAASHYVLDREDDEDGDKNSGDPGDALSQTSDDEEGAPMIIAEMQAQIDTMSVSQAVMMMDLAGLNALMFKNGKNGKLNMVYARKDGHIGWIDPQQ